jgi:predicted amidohydrolase YtcJ
VTSICALGAAATIVNATVFDGTKSQDWTSVRFADGLITKCSVASAAQEGDEVIGAGGGTVLRGLIDAHVHLVPGALAQSLTLGVTTVLDMFSKPGLVASAKEQAGSRPDVADVRSSCANAGPTDPRQHRDVPTRNQVTPGFTDTTDRNGRDTRIQALAQVPSAGSA